MTKPPWERFFRPQSVAVVGASCRLHSVGRTVMKNILDSGFNGPVLPVNPKYAAVCGVLAYREVNQLPLAPDLAVICTPPAATPGVVGALGRLGTRAAIVLTAGLEQGRNGRGQTLQTAVLETARAYSMRLMGPNCLGLISTGANLNASFAAGSALPGDIGFVTQSGALATAVLDWASPRGVGFSHFVSLGNSADLGFANLLDFLAEDRATRAILLYVEAVTQARQFMAAAQRAACKKPVVAVKAGRAREGAQAAASHTGALAGVDVVYDAAFRRTGIVRVGSIEGLFNAVETLARSHPPRGDRLAILTNGGGPGVLATDALILGGGRLATLSPHTLRQLDDALPSNWSRGNPVDIIGDATGERYVAALKALLADPAVDGVLVLHCPTALVEGREIAEQLIPLIRTADRPILTCWLGHSAVAAARRLFAAERIPGFESPEDAVQAFLQLSAFERLRSEVRQSATFPEGVSVPPEAARRMVCEAVAKGIAWLDERAAKQLLTYYGVPVVESRFARTAEEAARVAEQVGFPVALKVVSPDVTHKSDVGGVALDLEGTGAVKRAADAMAQRLREDRPAARLEGFSVQPMVRRPHAHEIIVGINNDQTFGPVIVVGQGGTATEIIADRAVGLPPLSSQQAAELLGETRVSKLLAGYRNRPPADVGAVVHAVVQVARLAVELPEVTELDINPLLVDERGAIALDARVRLAPAERNTPPALRQSSVATQPPAGTVKPVSRTR